MSRGEGDYFQEFLGFKMSKYNYFKISICRVFYATDMRFRGNNMRFVFYWSCHNFEIGVKYLPKDRRGCQNILLKFQKSFHFLRLNYKITTSCMATLRWPCLLILTQLLNFVGRLS